MPAKKKTAAGTQADLYDKLIATIPSIERKGDANPYTSLNGNMFTLLHQSKLAIRLAEDEREKFLRKYKTTLFEAYGTVMQRICSRPRRPARKHQRAEKVSGLELQIRPDTEAKTNHEEEALIVPEETAALGCH